MKKNQKMRRAWLPVLLIMAVSPVLAADAPLTLENGIPANSNYTRIDSGEINRGQITAEENVWVNFTTDDYSIGKDSVTGDGLKAVSADGETRYHVKLSRGEMTDNDASTFEVNNAGNALRLDAPMTAASFWIYSGRAILEASNAFNNVGTIYVAGGQLWFDGKAEGASIPSDLVIGTSNYNGDTVNNYYGAAFRMDANANLNGTVTVVSPAKLTFSNTATMTMASLGGSGDLNLVHQGNGTLKINEASAYTGTITIGITTVEFGTAVTALPKVILNREASTLKINAPGTFAAGSALILGTLDLSGIATLSDTAAALTIPDTSVTLGPQLFINLGSKRWSTATIRLFDVPAGAPADYLSNIRVKAGGVDLLLNADGTVNDYPDVRSAGSFANVQHRNKDLWLNVSAGGGLINGVDATGYNLKITSGSMTGSDPADPTTFAAQNGWTHQVTNAISAASLSIDCGRFNPKLTGLLANAGAIYVNGGHIFPSGAETFANDFVFSTSTYSEGNNYGGSVYRVDTPTAFNGTTTIRSTSKFTLGNGGTLSFAKLAGPGNITVARYGATAGRLLTVADTDAYAGTLVMSEATIALSLASGRTAAPAFILTAGSFTPPSGAITLRSGTALTSGTIDFSGTTLDSETPAMIVPAGATVSVGTGVTFQLGANYSFPVTLKIFEVETGATLNGWNPETASILMGTLVPARTVNADGSITFDIERLPITFTKPSSYWDSKTLPTTALQSVPPGGTGINTDAAPNAEAKTGFGIDPAYLQTLNDKDSTVANVTGGGNAYADIYGLHGRGGNLSTVNRDIWLAVTGGTFLRVVGGCENHWQNNNGSSIQGDILVEMKGSSKTSALIGGFQDSGYGSCFITGNIGVVVGENALVSGTVIGFANSTHTQNPAFNGDTAILIQNVQSENNYATTVSPFFAGWIIGGAAWSGNVTSGATINGNTAITVDIPSDKSGTFRKAIVGGSHSTNSNASKGTLPVSGTASVSISAPDAVRFLEPVYGAGYSRNNVPVSTWRSIVTINGGTFLSEIVAGGSGAQASVSHGATLSINGGVLTNTVVCGTSDGATGGSVLSVSGDRTIDLTQTTVVDFTRAQATDGATLVLGPATQIVEAYAANGGTLNLKGKTDSAETLRYIRLTVNDWPRSNPNGNLNNTGNLGIGELRLTQDGEAVSWGTGASITGVPAGTGSETVASMIDGKFNTKFFASVGTNPAYEFTITRGSDAPAFNGYEIFSTDQNGRNPTNWTLSGSVDGINWVVLDQRHLTYADVVNWHWNKVDDNNPAATATVPSLYQKKAFTCARSAMPSSIGTVIIGEGGVLTGSGSMIGDLEFATGSTVRKISTDPAVALAVSGTIRRSASGRVAVVGPDLELSSADKHYLFTGPGALETDPYIFKATDGLVVRRDATGLYLTKDSGLFIMLF